MLNLEYLYYIILTFIIFLVLRRLFPTNWVRNITTTELKKELKEKDRQFVDVRTPREDKESHIKELENIPLYQLPQKLNQLSKEKLLSFARVE